jgi:hypothetical protein
MSEHPIERCGYTVEPVLNRDGTFNPLTGQMRIGEHGGHVLFPARLYVELADDNVFVRVMNQAFFTPDDWAPPGSGFLVPDPLRSQLVDAVADAKPVEPRLEVRKMSAYVSMSTEEYEEGTAFARAYQEWSALTPQERAARTAERDAQRLAQHDAAVAEWEALRERYAGSPAVVAVLDIHHPDDEGRMECAHPAFGYEADAEDWPCSTYTAIKEATP